MNKLEQKRIERKKIILNEAKKLILKRGIFDGIMSELAKCSGISRQRLYVYYNSIDEIISDIREAIYQNSHVELLTTLPYTDPVSVIKHSILSLPQTMSEEMHSDMLFMSLFSVYSATNNIEIDKKNTHALLFEKQIKLGQQQGLFRTDHQIEHLSATITHILIGFLYHYETLSPDWKNNMLNEEILTGLADMILNYLKI